MTPNLSRIRRVSLLSAILMTLFRPAAATHLKIGDVAWEAGDAGQNPTARVSVGWDNAWHNDRNHDAAWVFLQVRGEADWDRARAQLVKARRLGGTPEMTVELAADGVGAFLYPPPGHRGAVSWELELEFDRSVLRERTASEVSIAAFAIEMVEIPSGSFTLGDPDPAALDFGAFSRSDAAGRPAGLVRVESEAQVIEVGPAEGRLDYRVEREIYQGDRRGPVPADFPKGHRRFYVMKYEITQGQYAAFLNNLPRNATYFRAPFAGRDYYRSRGSIRLDGQSFTADHPARPANFISWEDGLAFADWAGLRPMTELEFTKACRGPGEALAHEFPWGTDSRERLVRRVLPDDDLVTTGDADESRLDAATRDVLGASYYWVMDLAGSVWERVVTIGHPAGRAFRGSHGDGRLTAYGSATNQDWPRGDEGGGYGYRGGGHYGHDMEIGDFNPWSPIAYRTYGAWGAAPRYIAYGFRGVRAAP